MRVIYPRPRPAIKIPAPMAPMAAFRPAARKPPPAELVVTILVSGLAIGVLIALFNYLFLDHIAQRLERQMDLLANVRFLPVP
jgi:uncharacterized membrane protein (DUF106 family)